MNKSAIAIGRNRLRMSARSFGFVVERRVVAHDALNAPARPLPIEVSAEEVPHAGDGQGHRHQGQRPGDRRMPLGVLSVLARSQNMPSDLT